MLLLGIDLGTSSVKVSVVEAATQKVLASASFPESDAAIIALKPGWAEQDPELWWEYVQQAVLKCHSLNAYDPSGIKAIGIAYQMHGLVVMDKEQKVLRNSIIWCDSRAVETGHKAFHDLGKKYCLKHLLNAPGNFTASKLAWVKANEPDIYEKIDTIMLPGDFIALKFTGTATTTVPALSEGIFWDFANNEVSEELQEYFGFDRSFIPPIYDLFSSHGKILPAVASRLSLNNNVYITYKAGDQPNNALSLNVLNTGEVATNAGTSGVIYGISDQLTYDKESRINSFAHVNHSKAQNKIGVLLCINGTGIFNRWIRQIAGSTLSYEELNKAAAPVKQGADGLFAIPFGNGSERMLNNRIVGAHFHGIDFNIHTAPHMIRAVQEAIAFSFRYGLDIMRENGMAPSVIRAGKTNLFLSDIFAQTFANVNNVEIEFYEGDGSFGAAMGAGIGAGYYLSPEEAAAKRRPVSTISPSQTQASNDLYEQWKLILTNDMNIIQR